MKPSAALSEWFHRLQGPVCVPEGSGGKKEGPEILKDRLRDLTQELERVSVKTRYPLLPPPH